MDPEAVGRAAARVRRRAGAAGRTFTTPAARARELAAAGRPAAAGPAATINYRTGVRVGRPPARPTPPEPPPPPEPPEPPAPPARAKAAALVRLVGRPRPR